MKNIFNLDSKFFVFMSKVADVIILNLLFLLTSIPIVTIGASITALYSVFLKLADGKEPYIAKEYFRSWKENFRQSTAAWLILLPVMSLLLFSLSVPADGTVYTVMKIGMIAALVVLMMIALYLFPLLSKFENTVKQTILNAFLLSLRHFLTTCMMFGTTAFFIIITLAYPAMIQQTLMFWLLFGFALIVKINAMFLNPVFNSHIDGTEA